MKELLGKLVFIMTLFVFGFFLVFVFREIKNSTDKNSLPLSTNAIYAIEPAEIHSPPPVRLIIPTLDIDTAVEYVGLNNEGEMDVPKDPSNVAWFDLGTHPGDVGSAVIAGHSGLKDNKSAIFDNLEKLKIGDKIYVEDSGGTTTVFVAQRFQNYTPNENASSVFGLGDGKAHLNLITCVGPWNDTDKTHSLRLVVFADMLESEN